MFNITIFIIGLSGIIAQVLLLRELLVGFAGNELTVGIILANWILAEAIGVFAVGKVIERARYRRAIFVTLIVLFCIFLPICVYFARTFRSHLGIPFGQSVDLNTIFIVTFLVNFPVSFFHGALFSAACKLKQSLGKVYAWETAGTIAGGIIFTYLLIPFVGFSQWKAPGIIESRNSVYGNVAVAKTAGQYTFFYNGLPVITAPYPDMIFVQEFGNLPLLFHKEPKSVLVAGGGAGGLLNEILRHPVKNVDYAELDPLLIDMVRKYPTPLTERELSDKRVSVHNVDGRFFVRTAPGKYDVILVGLSRPQDLSVNRLFSQEFFALSKKRLNPDGLLAIYLPGSLSYLSQELKDINVSILNGLEAVYGYVRIIPGDYNIMLASDARGIMDIIPAVLTQRLNERKLAPGILVPGYLDYRLDKRWVEWFDQASIGATKEVNRDMRPIAVLENLALWTKQFSPIGSRIFAAAKKINLGGIVLFVLTLTTMVLLVVATVTFASGQPRLSVAYSIATTGFFGMLANMLLIFSFQVFYGYLYYKIGLLISVFMAGAALGSVLMTRWINKGDSHRLGAKVTVTKGVTVTFAFIAIELAIIIFSLALPSIISATGAYLWIFLVPGLLLGAQFPLAGKIYMAGKVGAGEAAGALYGADLLGGWVAGMLGGIVFLPVLGLFNTCMVIVLLKISSLIVFTAGRKPLTL
jgi:spermidine synthase